MTCAYLGVWICWIGGSSMLVRRRDWICQKPIGGGLASEVFSSSYGVRIFFNMLGSAFGDVVEIEARS